MKAARDCVEAGPRLSALRRVTFRKNFYQTLDALQTDLDQFLEHYNAERPHQGRWCYGKTPMQTFFESLELAKDKLLTAAAVN